MTKIYNTQESYSVWDKRIGRKIVDCSNIEDARMMLHMDVHNRQIIKNKTLMSITFDVELTKELPTSSITVVNKKENILNQGINKLPESQLEPIKI